MLGYKSPRAYRCGRQFAAASRLVIMKPVFVLSLLAGLSVLAAGASANNCGQHGASGADKLRKVKLTQTRAFYQYIEFMLPNPMPNLHDFTLCFWLRSSNFTFNHTTFSYAVPEEPFSLVTQIEPNIFGGGVKMIVNGKTIYNEPVALDADWNHLCHSWESSSAKFQLYVNGVLALQGTAPEARNDVIRGKGMPIAGQLQTKFNDGFDFAMGMEGDVIHYFLDSRPLVRGRIKGETYGVRDFHRRCNADQPKGNIVSWDHTDMKMYGGATYTLANPVCGAF